MVFLETGRYFFPFFRKNEGKWWPMAGTFLQISPKRGKVVAWRPWWGLRPGARRGQCTERRKRPRDCLSPIAAACGWSDTASVGTLERRRRPRDCPSAQFIARRFAPGHLPLPHFSPLRWPRVVRPPDAVSPASGAAALRRPNPSSPPAERRSGPKASAGALLPLRLRGAKSLQGHLPLPLHSAGKRWFPDLLRR